MKKNLVICFALVLLLTVLFAIPAYAAVPTVLTLNPNVDGTAVIMNGNITATGVVGNDDIRGFVWDTTQNADPGNVAPALSGYANNWTEVGGFGTGAFSYEQTGFPIETLHYFRACAHSADGWAYGAEICFLTTIDAKVYIEMRPHLDSTRIRGNAGIPTQVFVGVYNGYSLPIWNAGLNVNEELYFQICVPDRWDADCNIYIHIQVALANAGESGNSFSMQLAWEHVTPNEEPIPITTNVITGVRTVWSNTQYELYQCAGMIDYDINPADVVMPEDTLALRIRRIAVVPPLVELNGEVIMVHVAFMFARGDLLGDPSNIVLEDDMVLLAFIIFPLALIALAYAFKKQALMLAAVGAWIILGVLAYTESTGLWDVYYGLFWFSLGLALVTGLLAIGMRTSEGRGDEEGEDGEEDGTDRFLRKQEKFHEKQERINRAIESPTERIRRKRREKAGGKSSTRLS